MRPSSFSVMMATDIGARIFSTPFGGSAVRLFPSSPTN